MKLPLLQENARLASATRASSVRGPLSGISVKWMSWFAGIQPNSEKTPAVSSAFFLSAASHREKESPWPAGCMKNGDRAVSAPFLRFAFPEAMLIS